MLLVNNPQNSQLMKTNPVPYIDFVHTPVTHWTLEELAAFRTRYMGAVRSTLPPIHRRNAALAVIIIDKEMERRAALIESGMLARDLNLADLKICLQ
jgi:hypothetical protein